MLLNSSAEVVSVLRVAHAASGLPGCPKRSWLANGLGLVRWACYNQLVRFDGVVHGHDLSK